jgi:hypothetical protein
VDINSITGLLPRKINISFKRNDSFIEKIKSEIELNLANCFGFEIRIKTILEIQAKYSGNTGVVTAELINLCHGFILDEIEAPQPDEGKFFPDVSEVELSQAIVKKKQLWVEYYVKDSYQGWKPYWQKVKFWGYEEDDEEDTSSSSSLLYKKYYCDRVDSKGEVC